MSIYKNHIEISEELGKIKITKLLLRNNFLSNDLNSIKIIFLTDFHHGVYTNKNLIKEIVSITNDRKPDLILLGGDYVHMGRKHYKEYFYKFSGNQSRYLNYRRKTRKAIQELSEELIKLRAEYGIFSVFGNHDYFEGIRTIKKFVPFTNWVVNSSSKIKVGDSELVIYGVDDYREGQPDLNKTFQGYDDYLAFIEKKKETEFRIFLGHNPDSLILENSEYIRGTDLALFGHTHGGQVCLPGSIPIFTETKQKDYFKGFYRHRETPIYVSSGLGNSGVPFRLFCPPEIVEIVLSNT